MKITDIELYEVAIPPIAAIAKYYPKIYTLTDEGLEGTGEWQGPRLNSRKGRKSSRDRTRWRSTPSGS